MRNRERFQEELTKQYLALYESSPEYAYVRRHITAYDLAEKMVEGLITGKANKGGEGIKRTCKALNLPFTSKAIKEFLSVDSVPVVV